MPNIQIHSYTGQDLYPRIKTSNVINDAGFLAVSDSGSQGAILLLTSQGPRWSKPQFISNYIEITSVSDSKIFLQGSNIPVGVETSLGNYYPIQKRSLVINSDSIQISIDPYLAYDGTASFVPPWKVWFSSAPVIVQGGASDTQKIIKFPGGTSGWAFKPLPNRVYYYNLIDSVSDSLEIDFQTAAFSDSAQQFNFEMQLVQGAVYNSKNLIWNTQKELLWKAGNTFSSSNSAPALDLKALHCFNFRWDGQRLLGDILYKISGAGAQQRPLRLTAQAANSSVTLNWVDSSGSVTPQAVLYYRTAGTQWTSYTIGTQLQLTSTGDWVQFWNSANKFSSSTTAYYQFAMQGVIAASGNIMSLLNYGSMKGAAFAYLFHGCDSLTTAPELPATVLASSCYFAMFRTCTSLIVAPVLPASVLYNNCYQSMFRGCTSLTEAPMLYAKALVKGCCAYMFYGCTSLNAVTVIFDTWEDNTTTSWLSTVAASGTFTCPYGLSDEVRDTSHIPSGWTVVRV